MFRKIVKLLTNNAGLKIAAALIAVALWLVVVNYDNPEITKTFYSKITVVNPETIEEMGQVYDIVESSDTAEFSVTGKRSIMDNISSANFVATADLTQTDFKLDDESKPDNEIKLVPIEITPTRYENQLTITRKTVNMKIRIEDLSTEQFVISPVDKGEPADGYAIGDKAVNPNLLNISGPQSVVSQVSSVVANINVEGVSSDVTDRVKPVLYDENGVAIESDQLKFSQEYVSVSVKILGTKTVPIRCETSGTPADGYQFINLEQAPKEVTIKGVPDALDSITEIVIPIDLEGAVGNIEDTKDITSLLEDMGDNISLVDPEGSMIAVKAIIEKEATKVLELLPERDIRVDNLSEEYNLEFVSTTLDITLHGLNKDIKSLSVEQMQASIDLEGLKEGTKTVEVQLKQDDKYSIGGTVMIQVRIVKKEAAEEVGAGNSGGT